MSALPVEEVYSPYPKRVVLPVFEGPLDLLLHLVKINEMEIEDISIFTITRQYIDYLNAMTDLDLDVAGDFLVMAATLLNIKSRSLLPQREEEQQEDEEEVDEILSASDLIRRLVAYRKIKEAASSLRHLEQANSGVFYRAQVISIVPGAEDENELPRQDIRALFDAFSRVLSQIRQSPAEHHVVRERFTVEEKIADLRTRLRDAVAAGQGAQINMARLFERSGDKEEIVCFLLALLEMARLREITIAQAGPGDDILIAPWDEQVVAVG